MQSFSADNAKQRTLTFREVFGTPPPGYECWFKLDCLQVGHLAEKDRTLLRQISWDIEKLTEDRNSLFIEYRQLKEELRSELQDSISILNELKALSQERDTLKRENHRLQQVLSHTEAELKRLWQERNSLVQRNNAFVEERSCLQMEQTRLQQVLSHTEELLDEIRQERDALKQEREQLHQKNREHIASISQDIEYILHLKIELEQLKHKRNQLLADHSRLQQEHTSVQAELEPIRQERDTLKQENSGFLLEHSRLQQEQSRLQATLERLQCEHDTLLSQYHDLQQQAASATNGKAAKRADPQGFYKILGINPMAIKSYSDEQFTVLLTGAYRAATKRYHPDNSGSPGRSEELMKQVNLAHECLSNPQRRRAYAK